MIILAIQDGRCKENAQKRISELLVDIDLPSEDERCSASLGEDKQLFNSRDLLKLDVELHKLQAPLSHLRKFGCVTYVFKDSFKGLECQFSVFLISLLDSLQLHCLLV